MFLHPHFIKFEKPKNELNLTFSAMVDSEDIKAILDIQDKIKKIIEKSDELKYINVEETTDGLYKKIFNQNRFIYKYPQHTFHFSIVNFATYDIVALNKFESAREIIEKTDNFNNLKTAVKGFKDNLIKKISKDNIEVRIEKIYLPGGIENSLTLNVSPVDGNFFTDLKTTKADTEKTINENLIYHDLKIKAYPDEDYRYFALNVFRFIDKNNTPLNEAGIFYQGLEKINKEIKKENLRMKLCIVVSDPYLANNNPIIG